MATDYATNLMACGIVPRLPPKGTTVRVHFQRKWYIETTTNPHTKMKTKQRTVSSEVFTLPTFGGVIATCVNDGTRSFRDNDSFDAVVQGYVDKGFVYGTNRFPTVAVVRITPQKGV